MSPLSATSRYDRPVGAVLLGFVTAVLGAVCLLAAAVWEMDLHYACSDAAGDCVADERNWVQAHPGVVVVALALAAGTVWLGVRWAVQRRSEAAAHAALRADAALLLARVERDAGGRLLVRVRNESHAPAHRVSVAVRGYGSVRALPLAEFEVVEAGRSFVVPLPEAAGTRCVTVRFADAAGARWWLDVASGDLCRIA